MSPRYLNRRVCFKKKTQKTSWGLNRILVGILSTLQVLRCLWGVRGRFCGYPFAEEPQSEPKGSQFWQLLYLGSEMWKGRQMCAAVVWCNLAYDRPDVSESHHGVLGRVSLKSQMSRLCCAHTSSVFMLQMSGLQACTVLRERWLEWPAFFFKSPQQCLWTIPNSQYLLQRGSFPIQLARRTTGFRYFFQSSSWQWEFYQTALPLLFSWRPIKDLDRSPRHHFYFWPVPW